MKLPPRKKLKWNLQSEVIRFHKNYVRDVEQWESSNGSVQFYSEMDINHIKNCVAKIKREEWKLDCLANLEMELIYRQLTNQKRDGNERKHKQIVTNTGTHNS
jgi:hypothetical protein